VDPFYLTGSDNPHDFTTGSARFGLYGGYNWRIQQTWVFGLEADFAWASNKNSSTGIPGLNTVIVTPNDSVQMKDTWVGGVRGRVGYLIHRPCWCSAPVARRGCAARRVSLAARRQPGALEPTSRLVGPTASRRLWSARPSATESKRSRQTGCFAVSTATAVTPVATQPFSRAEVLAAETLTLSMRTSVKSARRPFSSA
jgi:hypothetical protein